MSASIRFDAVSRVFATADGAVMAVEEFTLNVEAGSFTALVGPSGCGKSTLLNVAAGLDRGHGGTVSVVPGDVERAFLFQTPRLLPWLTSVQNVAFPLEARGHRRRAARAKAVETLALVGLDGFERAYPAQLSGGMQQRVALARALVVGPQLLLMDEPFAALDEFTARRMRAELLDLHAVQPRTVLFVTHNLHEACFLADRVVVMTPRPGRIADDVRIDLPRPRAEDDLAVVRAAQRASQALGDHITSTIERI